MDTGHWSLDHVPSQRIVHRLIRFVAFRGGSRVRSMRSGTQSNFLFFFLPVAGVRKGEAVHKTNKFYKSFVQKPFALVPVFLCFRWTQKWLQGIQGPCGSFRKFSIKINFTLKPPRSPCLDSDRAYRMHAQGLRRDKIRDLALVYLFSEWQMACLLRTALILILQVLKIAFRCGLAYTRA